jgi:hypothetical protein
LEEGTTQRVTLRGTIELPHPGMTPIAVEVLEMRAEGSLHAPTSFVLRLEGPLHELARLRDRVPGLASLFPDLVTLAPDVHGFVELAAPPALLADIAEARLPPDAGLDLDALLSHEAWGKLVFDLARFEPRSVGMRTSHEVTMHDE